MDSRRHRAIRRRAWAESLADVDAELRALKDEERTLRQTIAGYEQRVENAPKRQQEFQEMSRDYDTTKERYDTLLKRYEEAQLAASLEQGQDVEQFRILDTALPPRDPVAPDRVPAARVRARAGAIGLAVGAVMAAEKLDTAFHRIEDLRAFVSRSDAGPRAVDSVARRSVRRNRRRAALMAVSAVVAVLAHRGRLALRRARQRANRSDDGALARMMNAASTRPPGAGRVGGTGRGRAASPSSW